MIVYSENYYLLKRLLTPPRSTPRQSEKNTPFEDEQKALALATLLAHSQLTTPRLTPKTVESFLNGKQGWPTTKGDEYFYTDSLPISFKDLKELGLISFYAGWLQTHFCLPREPQEVHETVKPLLQTMKVLQDIRWGSEELLKPCFTLPFQKATKLIKSFAPDGYLETLDCVHKNKEDISVQLGNYLINDSFLFYLWREIRAVKPSVEEAFSHWCDVLITGIGTLRISNMGAFCDEEREEFEDVFFKNLYDDPELNTTWKILQNRWILEERADQWVVQSTDLDTLINQWRELHTEPQNRREMLHWYERESGHFRFIFPIPYAPVLLNYIQWHLHIDHHSFSSSDKLEDLFALALDKPIMTPIIFYLLPEFFHTPDFALYLLARPSTSVIGVERLLSKYLQEWGRISSDSSKRKIQTECVNLIAETFLGHIKKESSILPHEVITLIRHYSAERVSLENQVNSFFQSFISKISVAQVSFLIPAIKETFSDSTKLSFTPSEDLFLIFRLLEKLHDEGIPNSSPDVECLQSVIIHIMESAFKSVWNNKEDKYLLWNEKTTSLSWELLDQKHVEKLLNFMPNIWDIKNIRSHYGKRHVLAFLLQALVVIVRKKPLSILIQPLLQIIELFGFVAQDNEDEYYFSLFEEPLHNDDADLWVEVCISANYFSDESFQRLIQVFDHNVSIRRILELYQHTQQSKRKEDILEKINTGSFKSLSEEGLNNLESAILIATDTNMAELANKLAVAGDQFITERFGTSPRDHYIRNRIDQWTSYQYKSALIEIYYDATLSTSQKQNKTKSFPIPDFHTKGEYQKSSEQFKRYILASILIEEDPVQSCHILEQLIKEDQQESYVNNWLAASLNKLEQEHADQHAYRSTLQEYKRMLPQFSPSNLNIQATHNYLSCLLELHEYSDIEVCWLSLDETKRQSLPVATVYCKKLKTTGEIQKAIGLLEQLKNYHQYSNFPKEQLPLLDELNDMIINDIEPKKLAHAIKVAMSERRSVEELTHYYQEIQNRSLQDIGKIISNKNATDFLYDNVISICKELLKRIAYLRQPSVDTKTATSHKITGEDNINNWFTSLFDQRLHPWGIHCSGQTQLGDSPNTETNNPGEIDGYFETSSGGIAIFEAFRLFSNDTKVITDHLNKLSGYNPEGLDPIFILGYCNVNDFGSLCSKYQNTINDMIYNDFSLPLDKDKMLPTTQGRLFAFSETRSLHDRQEITFFHILLNLH
jgi:hypothetical protein